LPEALAAVPAAGLTLLFGLVTPVQAGRRVWELLPTIAFLAAILVLARLVDDAGVFRWLAPCWPRPAVDGRNDCWCSRSWPRR
jgi:arsenical pump membrane protein